MKGRLTALLLALALVLSLCAVTATAGEKSTAETAAPAAEAGTENTESGGTAAEPSAGEAAAEDEVAAETEEEAPDLAGPDGEADTEIVLDEVGQVSFANIERRIRENNLVYLTLQESVELLESMDYEDMADDLRDQINMIAKGQWGLIMAGQTDSYNYQQLESTYSALKAKFDTIIEGDMQEDDTKAMLNLKTTQDQIVMGGESTYIMLVELELQEAALQRNLASMNRAVEELELRYQMGQVSALQLSELKAGRSQLASGLATLSMNIETLKTQLEMMLGAELTGQIRLGGVPEVTEKQLAAMNVEEDLLDAKAVSYEMYSAALAYERAQETYKDGCKEFGFNEMKLSVRQNKHTWQAAKYTYENAIQDYELRFRKLFAQVHDYKQILESAKVSLESEKASFAASELKYQQGTISRNAYLTAQDELKAAEEKVQTSANDLFSSYNTYCWAVKHGILN